MITVFPDDDDECMTPPLCRLFEAGFGKICCGILLCFAAVVAVFEDEVGTN